MTASPVQDAKALLASGQAGKAIALIEAAADAGDVAALMLLATWRMIGHPVARDLPEARALLARAVAIGHVDAALMEVALTANGSGGKADWQRALELLRNAARSDPVARQHLALLETMTLDAGGAPLTIPAPQPISTAPNVWRVRGLLSPAECAHIAQAGAPMLEPASVIDPQTGRPIAHPIRTAHGGAIGPTREDLVIRAINHRIAKVSETDIAQGEPLTVLHYAPGQEYRPHHDGLPGAANQRIRTVLLYLNQGFGGGETRFTANGLTVKPGAGDAILFDNVTPDGRIDPSSRHAGLPVTKGAKWLATRWIRAKPYNPWTDHGQ